MASIHGCEVSAACFTVTAGFRSLAGIQDLPTGSGGGMLPEGRRDEAWTRHLVLRDRTELS